MLGVLGGPMYRKTGQDKVKGCGFRVEFGTKREFLGKYKEQKVANGSLLFPPLFFPLCVLLRNRRRISLPFILPLLLFGFTVFLVLMMLHVVWSKYWLLSFTLSLLFFFFFFFNAQNI